ncbi:aminopeptidase [Chitinimonas sp. BJB300]|uniref:aminopeptidase n=1 Tax=Chitinimonas sp. BJB300 TaxID=1559339 RepID=UPI000C0F086A|nr:aminopeptidase [Chitinimonas sp. BJB300]PHV13199.1 aminopeptidase [Chitinimonas sp. BJB300]TSJ87172.1 aminopeptidase [Chitinimonas sp. BJB300]
MWRWALWLILPAMLSGCASMAYVGQAANGQAEVLNKARPIDELLADPATPPELRAKLAFATRVRAFAVHELNLPNNASYTRYTDLGRPYALWNIVSTLPLSLTPVESCFPIAGCLAYRGYYSQAAAHDYAQQRRVLGEDVYEYGVPAYSTLGWFEDPLLNSTVRYDDATLVRLIFHELAHQVVYVRDDSAFNEAFATAVELEGFERWVAAEGQGDAAVRYRQAEARGTAFRGLILSARIVLEGIYSGALADADKLAAKEAVMAKLAEDYAALKEAHGGYIGYDSWFQPVPNNAHLVSVATYHDKVPAFRALFAQSGSFPAFYAAAKALSQKKRAARDEALAALGVSVFSGEKQQGFDRE